MLKVNGFLTSQIGHDLGDPKRALIRSDRRDHVPDGARFAVLPVARTGYYTGGISNVPLGGLCPNLSS